MEDLIIAPINNIIIFNSTFLRTQNVHLCISVSKSEAVEKYSKERTYFMVLVLIDQQPQHKETSSVSLTDLIL